MNSDYNEVKVKDESYAKFLAFKSLNREWSDEWPIDCGLYWFYGWRWHDRDTPAELSVVKVRHGAEQRPFYVTDGTLIYKAEGGYGVWKPMEPPDTPDLSMHHQPRQ